jgi:peptidoglycan LD-endopeptidase LytH
VRAEMLAFPAAGVQYGATPRRLPFTHRAMSVRRMHSALPGAALAAVLLLPACTVAIGAAPERGPRRESEPPRAERPASAPRPGGSHAPGELAPGASLLIPVAGIGATQLRDTYHDPRSGGRTHQAIDIMAPAGTPVVAAADGTVHRLREGGIGGIALYQIGADGRTLYYYAHLQGYAAGIREGMSVRRGEVIAYVGDTGNAGRGNYHLHFSVGRLRDPARWWESENVNPYPLLAGEHARGNPVARDR